MATKRKPNMALLENLRAFIGEHLADIAEALDPKYRLTLVARYPGSRRKTIIVSDDNCILAAAELSAPDDDLLTVDGRAEGMEER